MELLEREAERALLQAAFDEARAAGRIVRVVGEAGVGRTRLVETVLGAARTTRVLWGTCDPLTTPRALGPLLDVARLGRARGCLPWRPASDPGHALAGAQAADRRAGQRARRAGSRWPGIATASCG